MDWNAELEALVREHPEDDSVWSVLQDWTLERGGLRARIIERLQAGDEPGAQEAVWELEEVLFGAHLKEFRLAINSEWRAGYLVRCWLKGRPGGRAALLDRVLSLRCSALMTRLHADLDLPEEVAPLMEKLRGTSLRELALNAYWKPTLPVVFEPSMLEPLRIERLHLMSRAMSLPYGAPLTRLTELWITPGSPDDLLRLFAPVGGFPRLTELAVYGRTLEHRHGSHAEPFARILSGEATPRLRRLHVRDVSEVAQAALLEAVAESPLLPKLEQFSFSYGGLDLHAVPERIRPAFVHLERAE
ncbi:MAG: hypothetical protein Q8L14_07985 [Myxococcales bacterium]|nr:hypothetical protein [Myxococcales bacterium]